MAGRGKSAGDAVSGVEWLQVAVQVLVLGLAVVIIRNALLEVKAQLKVFGETLTNCRLDIKDCVTWDELARELGPLRDGREDHEKRLGVLETKCEARHGSGK